jgi:hypothetical protein
LPTIGESVMGACNVIEVKIRRYRSADDCDVVVAYGGDEIAIRCRTYDDAVKWAQMECKSYRIAEFVAEN